MHPFLRAGQVHGNIVFNFRRDPVGDLPAWAAGYHSAAKRLVDFLDGASGYADYEGYPIFFLYRHALEVYLKAIVCTGAKLLDLIHSDQPAPAGLFTDHRLSPLLPSVKAIVEGVGWTWNSQIRGLETWRDFEMLIASIEEVDERGFAFRYPTDKKGHAILPHHFVLDVIHFGKSMDPLLDLLDGAVTGLEERFQASAEAADELKRLLSDWEGGDSSA